MHLGLLNHYWDYVVNTQLETVVNLRFEGDKRFIRFVYLQGISSFLHSLRVVTVSKFSRVIVVTRVIVATLRDLLRCFVQQRHCAVCLGTVVWLCLETSPSLSEFLDDLSPFPCDCKSIH